MFYAIRIQQITGTITERQLLKFYTKEDRVAYLEVRNDAIAISAKDAYKFSLGAPGYAVCGPEAGVIFFAHIIY